MRVLIYVYILSLLFSCNKSQNNNEILYKQFIKDSIRLDIDNRIYNNSIKKTFNIKQNYYLSLLDKGNSTLYIYNVKTFSLIYIKKNILNCEKIIDYDIHNFDTIYVLKNKNLLELTDTSFIPHKQYYVNDTSVEFNNKYELSCSIDRPLMIKGKYAYIFHYPTTILNTKEKIYNYLTKKLELKINIADNAKIVSYSGFFPKIYKKNTFNSYNPYRIFNDNYEIFSFNICDTVFLVNNKSKITKVVASNYYTKRDIFDFSKVTNFNYVKKYFVENPNYEQLLYDKYRKQYYRICKHRLNYENKDGSVNIPGDENWSLIVTDSNFHIQNEILFNSNYSRRDILITIDGVLIKNNNEDKTTKLYIFDF